MPFSERVKHLAKIKSAFRCCVCHKPFVEVHHLTPEADGGPSDISNAAPLCSSCHDLYGANPDKRKTLRQMRDYWWELMEKRENQLTDLSEEIVPYQVDSDPNFEGGLHDKKIAIYHLVFEDESFEVAAQTIAELIVKAQEAEPNQKRCLYLDIEGHRNELGGFDEDMFELQRYFLMGFMMPYLTELHVPLGGYINTKYQRNDVPSGVKVITKFGRKEINQAISEGIETVWLADQDASLRLPKQHE
jgi:hypothetical protein